MSENTSKDKNDVAIFIDFENVAISAENYHGRLLIDRIMEQSEKLGRCAIRRAYGDWTRFERYRQDLTDLAIDLTQLFLQGYQRKKNGADIRMAIDALETAITQPRIETFVLVTGDSDFSAVVNKLRGYGKRVVGIGLRQSTSRVLVRACDQFIWYDALIPNGTRTITYDMANLLRHTLRRLAPQYREAQVPMGELMNAVFGSEIALRDLYPDAASFRAFLEAQPQLVQVTDPPAETPDVDPNVALTPIAAQYLASWEAVGLTLINPRTRKDILRDFFALLEKEPNEYTLDGAFNQLKLDYDTVSNRFLTPEDIQEVTTLVRYADVLQKPNGSKEDRVALRQGLTAQSFRDFCESVYLSVLVDNRLELKLDVISLLIFGTADQSTRVAELRKLLESQQPAPAVAVAPVSPQEDQPAQMSNSVELDRALRDLNALQLEEEPGIERAAELNRKGLDIRRVNFAEAAQLFLRAARMLAEMYEDKRPGVSWAELEWYLASYCASKAGAHFSSHAYRDAKDYYLAFFSLVRESRPVWNKMTGLRQPMLTYFFTTAANINNEKLEVAPSETPPAKMAVILHRFGHESLVYQSWLSLLLDLKRVNPSMLRLLIDWLRELEADGSESGARVTRETVEEILHAPSNGHTSTETAFLPPSMPIAKPAL